MHNNFLFDVYYINYDIYTVLVTLFSINMIWKTYQNQMWRLRPSQKNIGLSDINSFISASRINVMVSIINAHSL